MFELKKILFLLLIMIQTYCIGQDTTKTSIINHNFAIEAGLNYSNLIGSNYTPRDTNGFYYNPIYIGYKTIPLISFHGGFIYDCIIKNHFIIKTGILLLSTRTKYCYDIDSLQKYGPIITLYGGRQYEHPLQSNYNSYKLCVPIYIGGLFKNVSLIIGGKFDIFEFWTYKRKFIDNSISQEFGKNARLIFDRFIPSTRIDYFFKVKKKQFSIYFSVDRIYKYYILQSGLHFNIYFFKNVH